ncbi:MAG: tRNA-modifying protein YgfZ [Idiomarina sp.]
MLATEFTKAAPEYVTVSLADYGAIKISGDQAETFLQGQLTCDVRQLTSDQWLYGAHCDNKGKTLSVFRICRWADSWLLIQPKASIPTSLAELQKYAVFSKVDVTDASDQYVFTGVFGHAAPARLADQLQQPLVEPVHQTPDHVVLQVGSEPAQYLIVGNSDVTANSEKAPEIVWRALEIERGRATLSNETVQMFVPQMLNLQALNAISFSKGCYIGQETVARMKYLGKQKRALFRLVGTGSPAVAGATIEMAIGDNWRRAGTVINAVSRTDRQLDLLAVMPSDSDNQTNYRLQGDDASLLEIHSLPYNLDES